MSTVPSTSLSYDERAEAPRRMRVLGELRRLQRRELQEVSKQDLPCGLCGQRVGPDHRHLVRTSARRILCVCEPCRAQGAAEAGHPAGSRMRWIEDFDLPEGLWVRLGVPVGLAFFLRSSASGGLVGVHPGPAGAVECAPDVAAWAELLGRNPGVADLTVDVEALLVSRLPGASGAAILPVDECYRLVGLVRRDWQGVSGGGALRETVPAFLQGLRARAVGA